MRTPTSPRVLSLLTLAAVFGHASLADAAPKRRRASPKATPDTIPAADAEPELPRKLPEPVHCPVPFEAPAGADLEIRCALSPALRASGVTLFLRGSGEATFREAPMSRTPRGWYTVRISGSELTGTALQYYVSATARDGKPVGASGHAEGPNVIMLRQAAAPEATAEATPVETPSEARLRFRRAQSWWLGWGLGTGVGWHARARLETAGFNAEPNVAMTALGHISPEVGYQLSDRLGVSLGLRVQVIPKKDTDPTNPGSPKQWAFAALARGSYRVWLSDDARLRAYATFGAGAGHGFRFRIAAQPGMGLDSTDTVRGGPVVFGPGAGASYALWPRIHVGVGLEALVGAPDMAVTTDVTGAVQLAF